LSHGSTFIGQGPMTDKVQASGIRIIPSIPNDKLRELMSSHRFFLSFSKTEGSPKALLEAVFCGLVPILSDIPIHREIIQKLGYGLIINETTDFKPDSTECNVNYDNLSNFMHEFSLVNHIAAEIKFLQQCANR
jgi:glycosyltransferase involved in cell wall biosynthesis